MAVTKIHPIKATVGNAIEYVINPKKTDEYSLVDTFGCTMQTAEYDFKFALSHCQRKVDNPNMAFHIIQSFKPDETDPETAHRIGLELADRLYEGKYSFVLGTHVDKHHIHNHIIICAVDNIDYKKFNNNRAAYMNIRKESDRLCEENGLSIIKEDKGIAKCYKEWMESQNGTSWKDTLKKDINECTKKSISYDDFIKNMLEKGYQIKGEKLDNSNGKYISFLCPGSDRWIRGKRTSGYKGLGEYYSKEQISKRIEERASSRISKIEKAATSKVKTVRLNFEEQFFKENPNLLKWGKRENVKRMAAAYAELDQMGYKSREAASKGIAALKKDVLFCSSEIKSINEEIKKFANIIKYYRQYCENKRYHDAYEKSKDPERYMQARLSEITLFDEAERVLRKSGIDPEHFNVEKFKSDYLDMKNEKSALQDRQKSGRADIEKISRILSDLKEFEKDKNLNL